MSLTVTKVDVWAAEVEDSPGGLAKLLGAVAGADANLECVIARRDAAKAGKGVAFLTPLKGANVRKAAKAQGLSPAKSLATLKVEGDDSPGLGSQITAAIANAGINLRGVSGTVIGRKFVVYLGFDGPADATKAVRALKTLANPKKAQTTRRVRGLPPV
jgi:hypothetical protein